VFYLLNINSIDLQLKQPVSLNSFVNLSTVLKYDFSSKSPLLGYFIQTTIISQTQIFSLCLGKILGSFTIDQVQEACLPTLIPFQFVTDLWSVYLL
jgi:hypothetical protein